MRLWGRPTHPHQAHAAAGEERWRLPVRAYSWARVSLLNRRRAGPWEMACLLDVA
jgi:hypothetical protein